MRPCEQKRGCLVGYVLGYGFLPKALRVHGRLRTCCPFRAAPSLFKSCGKGYAVQWGDIGRTEADVVAYSKEDRRIAAIRAMRAGSDEELPALAEKAFRQAQRQYRM